MPTATSGFEGLESKNNPSKEGFSNTGSVQKVGKKKAAGPLKFVAFKNNVQDWFPVWTSTPFVCIIVSVSGNGVYPYPNISPFKLCAIFNPSGAHRSLFDNWATLYFPPGTLQSLCPFGKLTPLPAPGPFAEA